MALRKSLRTLGGAAGVAGDAVAADGWSIEELVFQSSEGGLSAQEGGDRVSDQRQLAETVSEGGLSAQEGGDRRNVPARQLAPHASPATG